MEYIFLNKDGEFKFNCATDAPGSLQLYNTKYMRRVDTPSEVFEADYLVHDRNGTDIVEGDVILFSYDNQYRELKIQELNIVAGEGHIYAENNIMELSNDNAPPFPKPPQSMPIDHYLLGHLGPLGYTDIQIGINEVSDQKRQLEYTGTTDTKMARLNDILNGFNCEGELLPVMSSNKTKVEGRRLNIYRKKGGNLLSDQLIDDVNIIEVETNRSLKELKTAIEPTGKDGANIINLEYDDGEYYTKKGMSFVVSRKAADKWASIKEDDLYFMYWSYETDNATELMKRSITELKKYDDVKVAFRIEGLISGEIGNQITISTKQLGKEKYLSARIIQHEICLEDRTKDKVTAGDFVETQSEIDKAVKAMQDELAKLKLINAVVIAEKSQFVNLVEDNSFTCFLYVNDEDADTEGTLYRYDWTITFYGADGAEISSINKTGKTITVLASDWPNTAVSMNYELEWGIK